MQTSLVGKVQYVSIETVGYEHLERERETERDTTRMSFKKRFPQKSILLNNKLCIVDFIKRRSIEQLTHSHNLISPLDVCIPNN